MLRDITEASKPEDFIGYENEMFKVIAINTETQELSVELKGSTRVATFNIDFALQTLEQMKGI